LESVWGVEGGALRFFPAWERGRGRGRGSAEAEVVSFMDGFEDCAFAADVEDLDVGCRGAIFLGIYPFFWLIEEVRRYVELGK